MEKVKEFVKNHKKEILIGAGLIFAYRLGFKKGCKATEAAVDHMIEECLKAYDVIHF